jgi:membrane associated rhomboid family serine protease
MESPDANCKEAEEWLYSIRGTVGFGMLIGVVYGIQLALAGSLNSGAGYRVAEEYLRPNPGAFFAFAPVAHSTHIHIASNLFFLLIGGVITERILGTKWFLMFLYASGVLSCFLPPYSGLGGPGIGISGGNLALWTFFGLYYFVEYQLAVPRFGVFERRQLIHLGIAALGTGIALRGIMQFLGLMSTPSGVAKGSHLLGVLLGVLGFVVFRVAAASEPTGLSPNA